MKIFLSYRYTGEDPEQLRPYLAEISECLRSVGYDVFNSFEFEREFRENGQEYRAILDYCLKKLVECDTVLALVRSTEHSNGMREEITLAKQQNRRIVLAVQEGIESEFSALAHDAFAYSSMEDLCAELRKRFP
jgi:hypothetical protein